MKHLPSPNHDARPPATPVSLLIIHYTNMPDADAALRRLCAPEAKVSAHYLIARDGETFALVDETRRAWHAGVASWRGRRDINARSIGIELDHDGHDAEGRQPPFPDVQMAALVDLSRDIVARHALRPENILAHSDVAPLRKTDPGEAFDWAGLAAAGVGLWPDTASMEAAPLSEGDTGMPIATWQARLAAYGYAVSQDGVFGAETAAITRAFQRHFRPARVDGVADPETQARLDALLTCVAPAG